jgi:hypothetical protein
VELVKRHQALRVYKSPKSKRAIRYDDTEVVVPMLKQVEMREEIGL